MKDLDQKYIKTEAQVPNLIVPIVTLDIAIFLVSFTFQLNLLYYKLRGHRITKILDRSAIAILVCYNLCICLQMIQNVAKYVSGNPQSRIFRYISLFCIAMIWPILYLFVIEMKQVEIKLRAESPQIRLKQLNRLKYFKRICIPSVLLSITVQMILIILNSELQEATVHRLKTLFIVLNLSARVVKFSLDIANLTLFALCFQYFISKKREMQEGIPFTRFQNFIIGAIWTIFCMNTAHAVFSQILGFLEFVHSISDTVQYQTISMVQLEILIPTKDCLTLMGLTYLFSYQAQQLLSLDQRLKLKRREDGEVPEFEVGEVVVVGGDYPQAKVGGMSKSINTEDLRELLREPPIDISGRKGSQSLLLNQPAIGDTQMEVTGEKKNPSMHSGTSATSINRQTEVEEIKQLDTKTKTKSDFSSSNRGDQDDVDEDQTIFKAFLLKQMSIIKRQ